MTASIVNLDKLEQLARDHLNGDDTGLWQYLDPEIVLALIAIARSAAAALTKSPVVKICVGNDEPLTRSTCVMAKHADGTFSVLAESIDRRGT